MEDKTDIAEAKKRLQKRLSSPQLNDPTLVQLIGGGWGKIARSATGQLIVIVVYSHKIAPDGEFDQGARLLGSSWQG